MTRKRLPILEWMIGRWLPDLKLEMSIVYPVYTVIIRARHRCGRGGAEVRAKGAHRRQRMEVDWRVSVEHGGTGLRPSLAAVRVPRATINVASDAPGDPAAYVPTLKQIH